MGKPSKHTTTGLNEEPLLRLYSNSSVSTWLNALRYIRRVHLSGLFDRQYYLLQASGLEAERNPLLHYLTHGFKEELNPHPLFDGKYYFDVNPDVANARINPLIHFLVWARFEDRDPHPLFSVRYYFAQCPDRRCTTEPLRDYLESGWTQGFNPHPLFDGNYYLSCNSDVVDMGVNPLLHYVQYGWREGRNPHPLFEGNYYLSRNPDLVNMGVDPLPHYVQHGWKEGRSPHPLFDGNYYLSRNSDVVDMRVNPLLHYVQHGWREGRNPHPLFDGSYYLAQNPDVAADEVNPLVHFILHGSKESRDPHPHFDCGYYVSQNPDVNTAGINPLAHYLSVGALEGRDPNPVFDTSEYVRLQPEVRLKGINPLAHYLDVKPVFDLNAAFRMELERSKGVMLDTDVTPLVSAIIACRDGIAWLESAVMSVLLACSHPIEILVVCDKNLDKEALKALQNLAARYRFAVVQTSGCLGAFWREGVQRCQGRFLQLLDSSVLLVPEKIDVQVEELQSNPLANTCIANYEFCDAAGLRRWDAPLLGDTSLVKSDPPSLPVHCGFFRKAAIESASFSGIADGLSDTSAFWRDILCLRSAYRCLTQVLSVQRVVPERTEFRTQSDSSLIA